jgi:hypothetical protein
MLHYGMFYYFSLCNWLIKDDQAFRVRQKLLDREKHIFLI